MKKKQTTQLPIVAKPNHQLKFSNPKRTLVLALIIGLIGFSIYSNTFSHGYVLDDFSAIKENNIVKQGNKAIPEIFKTSYRQGYLSVKDGLYRPLSLVTYAIEWNYYPNKPSLSHFVNVILYAITGMLLFIMLRLLFTFTGSFKKGETIAFIASLLFIVHPLHTEVVANIKSRDEILCFLFMVCSFITVFKYIESQKVKYLVIGLIFFMLSLLSKETSITFLALLPLAVHFFTSSTLKKNIAITAFFIGTALVYLYIRNKVLGGGIANLEVSVADNFILGAKSLNEKLGSVFFVLGLYVKLLLFPNPLSYDYSFNQIPIVGMSNLFSIFSLVFFTVLGIFALIVLYKSLIKNASESIIQKEMKFITVFGIFFFLITIFLFSNLVLTIGTSMGDRLMYFPSLGFCILISVLMVHFFKIDAIDTKKIENNSRLIPTMLIVLFFSYKTYSRNFDWKDNNTLYSKDVKTVPNSAKAHYYLGLELIKVIADKEQDPEKKRKIYEEGIVELRKAVEILPAFGSVYTQMGVAYHRLKNYEKAIENYKKASSLSATDAITLNNIGTIYFEWKKYEEAMEYFKKALQIDSRYIDAYINLGSVYGTVGDFQNAIISFQNAITYAPENGKPYYFLALTYANTGDKINADKYYKIALEKDPTLHRPGN
jgi:tetratricopeptide (TPR) repeat protein